MARGTVWVLSAGTESDEELLQVRPHSGPGIAEPQVVMGQRAPSGLSLPSGAAPPVHPLPAEPSAGPPLSEAAGGLKGALRGVCPRAWLRPREEAWVRGPWSPPSSGKEGPGPAAQEVLGNGLQMGTNLFSPQRRKSRYAELDFEVGPGVPSPTWPGWRCSEPLQQAGRGRAAPLRAQSPPPLPPRRKSCTRGSGTRTCFRT